MTTGRADACAPSRATKASPSLAYADVGRSHRDGPARQGVRGSAARLRDRSPGPHPYLIGSLARAVIDAARAVACRASGRPPSGRLRSPGGGRRVAVRGPLRRAPNTGALQLKQSPRSPADPSGDIVHVVAGPVRAGSPTGELVALAALLISGASTVDPAFADLVTYGGRPEPRRDGTDATGREGVLPRTGRPSRIRRAGTC